MDFEALGSKLREIPPKVIYGCLAASAIGYAYYKYFTWHFGVFKKLGIPGPTPYPLVGTWGSVMKEGFMQGLLTICKENAKVFGAFQGRVPTLMISDADMLREILVKEFQNFQNHAALDIESPGDLMLIMLRDDHWKHVRTLISPTFSARKLKLMTDQMNRCSKLLVANILRSHDQNESFEAGEYCGAYTMDVIASTAFGLQINSQIEKNNPFIIMAKKSMLTDRFDWRALVFIFFPFLVPYFKKLHISIGFPSDVSKFFMDATREAIKKKDESGITQPDFLQLMINAHNETLSQGDYDEDDDFTNQFLKDKQGTWNKKGLTEEEILAQALLFFVAGYVTTQTTLSFLLHNLATNPDCQETLYRQIEEAMEGQDTVTYDVVREIPYMEWCINETLRIFPPSPLMDRQCSKDTTIKGVFIPKGMVIHIPVYYIHMCEDFWPEPDKFKPERFSPEEKAKQVPFTWMPFGHGPRGCIGKRLALLELKIAVVHLVRNFKFALSEKTQMPLKLDKGFQVKAENGLHFKVERR